jgi:general stress protein 26
MHENPANTPSAPGTPSSSDAETAAKEREQFLSLLSSFDEAMLVTLRDDTSLHARPMRIARAGSGGDLWFATAIESQKVEEVRTTESCAVTLQRPRAFLTISGLAEVVRDRELIAEMWQESWRLWFPEGPNGASLCLIHVVPEHAEYWDNTGIKAWRFMLGAAFAALRGRTPEAAGPELHGKVAL